MRGCQEVPCSSHPPAKQLLHSGQHPVRCAKPAVLPLGDDTHDTLMLSVVDDGIRLDEGARFNRFSTDPDCVLET